MTGEVSGPYSQSPYYYFRVKQELGGINSLKSFEVGHYSRMIDEVFYAPGILINAKITYEEHDADHLLVRFQNNDSTVGIITNGSFRLTRKE